MTKEECKKVIGDGKTTFYKIAAGIKEGVSAGRYPTCVMAEMDRKVDVSLLAYLDYRANMKMLSNPKYAAYVDKYDPKVIAENYPDKVALMIAIRGGNEQCEA